MALQEQRESKENVLLYTIQCKYVDVVWRTRYRSKIFLAATNTPTAINTPVCQS